MVHTTYKNGDDWGMVCYCFTRITIFYISFNLGSCKRHDFGRLAGSILSKVATSSEFKPEDVRCSARRRLSKPQNLMAGSMFFGRMVINKIE